MFEALQRKETGREEEKEAMTCGGVENKERDIIK